MSRIRYVIEYNVKGCNVLRVVSREMWCIVVSEARSSAKKVRRDGEQDERSGNLHCFTTCNRRWLNTQLLC